MRTLHLRRNSPVAGFADIPVEILDIIAMELPAMDFHSLSLTTRTLHRMFNPIIYQKFMEEYGMAAYRLIVWRYDTSRDAVNIYFSLL